MPHGGRRQQDCLGRHCHTAASFLPMAAPAPVYVAALGGVGDLLPFLRVAQELAAFDGAPVRVLTHTAWERFLALEGIREDQYAVVGEEEPDSIDWPASSPNKARVSVACLPWRPSGMSAASATAQTALELRCFTRWFAGARGVVAGFCCPHALTAGRRSEVPTVCLASSPPQLQAASAERALQEAPSAHTALRQPPAHCAGCVSEDDVRLFLASELAARGAAPLAGPSCRPCPLCRALRAPSIPLFLLLSHSLADPAVLRHPSTRVAGAVTPRDCGEPPGPPRPRKRGRAGAHPPPCAVAITFGSMAELSIVPPDAALTIGLEVAAAVHGAGWQPAVLCILPRRAAPRQEAEGASRPPMEAAALRGAFPAGPGVFALCTPAPLEAALRAWTPACVVHHGGAGTVAAGARCGATQVVVPCGFDQPTWGQRVTDLGIGTAVRAAAGADLDVAAVAAACVRLVRSEPAQSAAQRLAAALSREPCGARVAARAIAHRWAGREPDPRRLAARYAALAEMGLARGGDNLGAGAGVGVGALSPSVRPALEIGIQAMCGSDGGGVDACAVAMKAAVAAGGRLQKEEEDMHGPLPPSRAVDPLWPPLTAAEYAIMERDLGKYVLYGAAVADALGAWVRRGSGRDGKPCRAAVLGAGRGSLVRALLDAADRLEVPVRVVALEANEGAVESLRRTYAPEIRAGRVDVAPATACVTRADVEAVRPRYECDLIVSELLGTAADNEGMPEVLGAAGAALLSRDASDALAEFAARVGAEAGGWETASAPPVASTGSVAAGGNDTDTLPPCPCVPACYSVLAAPISPDSKALTALRKLGRPRHAAYLASASHLLRSLAAPRPLWSAAAWDAQPLRDGTLAFALRPGDRVGGLALFFTARLGAAPLWVDSRPTECGGSGLAAYHWEALVLPLEAPVRVGADGRCRIRVRRLCEAVPAPWRRGGPPVPDRRVAALWLEWGADSGGAPHRDEEAHVAVTHNVSGSEQWWKMP